MSALPLRRRNRNIGWKKPKNGRGSDCLAEIGTGTRLAVELDLMNPGFAALCLLRGTSPRLLRSARDGEPFLTVPDRLSRIHATEDHLANAAGVVLYELLAHRPGRLTFSPSRRREVVFNPSGAQVNFPAVNVPDPLLYA